MIPIFVLTCDKYLETLKGFAVLFNQYWSPTQPVTVLGFTPPSFNLPDNFSFHSLGSNEDYPVDKWSDGLIQFHKTIAPEQYILFFEDYWLTRPVKRDILEKICEFSQTDKTWVKFDLASDRQFSADVKEKGVLFSDPHIDLLESAPWSQYHFSLYIGLFKRSALNQILIPNETPWQMELDGTARLSRLSDLKVYGTKQCPIKITLIHRGGDPSHFLLDELNEDDKTLIKSIYGT